MDQAGIVQKITKKIIELGLSAPAIFLLEANKPLAFVGSQVLLVAQPTLDLFVSRDVTGEMADLLADPEQLDQLIAALEAESVGQSNSRELGP